MDWTLSTPNSWGGDAALQHFLSAEVMDAGTYYDFLDLTHIGLYYIFPTLIPNPRFRCAGRCEAPLPAMLSPGTGFWVRLAANASAVHTGRPVASLTLNLIPGWNLVSGPECVLKAGGILDADEILIPNTIYGYDGSYRLATSLCPRTRVLAAHLGGRKGRPFVRSGIQK